MLDHAGRDMTEETDKATASKGSGNRKAYKRVYKIAEKAMELIDRYDTPPYPGTYALWYAYAAKSNEALTQRVDEMLQREAPLSPYEIEEVHQELMPDDKSQNARDAINQKFEHELTSVLQLIDSGMDSSDKFEETLTQIGNGMPEQASADRMDAILTRLIDENRRMAEHSRELNQGLRESRKQIQKLNQELEDVRSQCMRDPLTKISNRRAFDSRLAKETASVDSTGEDLCLAIADIDHFKQVNDTYGHRIGDEVLKLFASLIGDNIKGQDMVARYGGEEFAIILPRTDLSAAYKLIDHVREQFSRLELVLKPSNRILGSISASFGIALYDPGMGAAGLIEQADKLLYRAKHKGRNRVEIETIPAAMAG